jgi:hypothetical protein
VVGLDLSNNNLVLNTAWPNTAAAAAAAAASAALPSELWLLAENPGGAGPNGGALVSLTLAYNPGLAGARLDGGGGGGAAGGICRARALRFLDLSSSGLAGSLPPCVAEMVRLETLALHSNRFEGAIPQEWGRLGRSLRALHLHGNAGLDGEKDVPKGLLDAPGLTSFTLPAHMRDQLSRRG